MSDWIDFVKQFAQDNGLSYKESLSEASKYYKKGGWMQVNRFPKSYAVGAGDYRGKMRKWNPDYRENGEYDNYNQDELVNRIRNNYLGENEDLREQMFNAGVLIGGALMGGDNIAPKGALAALLSGLNATIKVE